MADIRIIDQQELTSLENDAYVVTDNSSDGTHKYNLKRLNTAISTVQSDISTINDTLETKADDKGSYNELTAGSAEQLLSDKYTIDQVPYTFRASGGDGADREYDEIVGGSIVWNQLCNGSSVMVLNGHKYYMLKGGTASIGASTGSAITGLASGTDMVSDLTQMFGTAIADYIYSLETATAGAGVEWLKKYNPKMFVQYHPYDAGTMMHVSGLISHDMVGFNQCDEEWESGSYDVNTGLPVTYASRIRCKNPIMVVSGAQYYCKYTNTVIIRFYDFDDNFMGKSFNTTAQNSIVTVPSNAAYMRIALEGATSYSNNVCINLSDPTKNCTYEPYVKHSYPLDDSLTLRGIPKLDENNQLYYDGDTYAADGTVTRKYGIVDLGTLTWGNASATGFAFASLSTVGSGNNNVLKNNFICDKYGVAYWNASDDKTVRVSGSGTQIGVKDTSFASYTAAQFKTAMSGVYLVYELTAPTTEEAEPYNEVQIVDGFGTEEYVTTSLVPVGHYTKYPANLRSAIERVTEQVPEAPSANGTYTLKATRTSNGVTYAWTAD